MKGSKKMETIEFTLNSNNLISLYPVASNVNTAYIISELQALPTISEKADYVYNLMPEFEKEVKEMVEDNADDPEWLVRIPQWARITD
jgi:hypothetical protein